MNVFITGASGMLGSSFKTLLADLNPYSVSRQELQRSNLTELEMRISPSDLLINCAADTDVEGAENAADRTLAVNAILPGRLAALCRRRQATLMHWSSTGCYGDWKVEPYTEEDELRPLSVHHRSKALGESEVRSGGCEHLIFRTGWLYGGMPESPKNFVWKRMVEALQSERMVSDSSQRGTPTSANEAARQAMVVFAKGLRGTFNLTAQGSASRFDYVTRIISKAGLPCIVEPGSAFKRRAPVSKNEVGVNKRLKLYDLEKMRDWRDALDEYVHELAMSEVWLDLKSRS